MNSAVPVLVTALTLASAPLLHAQSAHLREDRSHGAATIEETKLREWLTHLTSEELGGRGTGQAGFGLAANFVRDHFKAIGLEGITDEDDGYFQTVPWEKTTIDPAKTRLTLTGADGREAQLSVEDGLRASAGTNENTNGPVAVVAFGGDLEALEALEGLSDYNVILVGTAPIEGGLRTYYRISRALRRADARLLAVVDDAMHASITVREQTGPGNVGNRAARGRGRVPRIFALTHAQAETMFAATGMTAPTEAGAVIKPEGATATATVLTTVEPAPAFNVCGVLRGGGDPKLAAEYVVVGSHLDHLGRSATGYSPGADDDGSGTVAVMAIAEAFAKNPIRPQRSLLFVTFCGEERGLLGSAYFAKNCPIPLESIAAELQVDMVGRSEEKRGKETADENRNCLHLIGTEKLSGDFHALCLERNEAHAKFDLEFDEESVFYRSDHWNFARQGIPIAFFFTGFHPDYHRPSDTVDKIEFDKLARIATYIYDIAFETAQRDQRPLVDLDRWESLQRKGRREPAAPVRR